LNNYDWSGVTLEKHVAITVNKAAGLIATAPAHLMISSGNTNSKTFDLSAIAMNKSDHGTLSYALGAHTGSILATAPTLSASTLSYEGNGSESGTATQIVTISSQNYTDIDVTITFEATDKVEVAIVGLTVQNSVYDGSPKRGVSGTASSGAYTGELLYAYTGMGITPSSTPPTNAGDYTLTVSVPSTANYIGSASYAFIIEKATAQAPTGFTATYGQTLSQVTPALSGGWAWVEATTTPVSNAGTATHKANYTPSDLVNYSVLADIDLSITVAKANGAAVASPASATATSNSITINAVAAPANGQVVEYGINTSNTAPSTWQTGLNFTGLKANTTYYIFARSKENIDYNAGTPSASLQAKTSQASSGGGYTSIDPLEIAISNLSIRAISGAIVLENLPSNAKVEAYNLQGKRIFTSGEPLKSGESGLRIAVQAKGMYIVKVSSGSKTETLRMAVR